MMPMLVPLDVPTWAPAFAAAGAVAAAVIAALVQVQARSHATDTQERQFLHEMELKAQDRAHQERLAQQERLFQQQVKLEDRAHDWQVKQADWERTQSQVPTNYPTGLPDPSWLNRMPPPAPSRRPIPFLTRALIIVALFFVGGCTVLSLGGGNDSTGGAGTTPSASVTSQPPVVPADQPTGQSSDPPPDPTADDLDPFFADARVAADAQVDHRDPEAMKAYYEFPLGWFGGKPLSAGAFADKLDDRGPKRIFPAEYVRTCWRDGDTVQIYVRVPYEIRKTGQRPTPDKDLFDVHLTGDPDDPFRIINIDNGSC